MSKKGLFLIILFSVASAVILLHGMSQWEFANLQSKIAAAGFWAPLVYMLVYAIATALILPSTVLNLAGGALFGLLWGILWTTLAAVSSAIFTFWTTRLWIKDSIQQHLSKRFQMLDQEISNGGIFYLFAVRLLPIIPYGVVNYSAGITSITFRDYLISTTVGTILGLLPFIMLGNSGVEAISTGQFWRVLIPMTLIGFLIAGATWLRKIPKN